MKKKIWLKKFNEEKKKINVINPKFIHTHTTEADETRKLSYADQQEFSSIVSSTDVVNKTVAGILLLVF